MSELEADSLALTSRLVLPAPLQTRAKAEEGSGSTGGPAMTSTREKIRAGLRKWSIMSRSSKRRAAGADMTGTDRTARDAATHLRRASHGADGTYPCGPAITALDDSHPLVQQLQRYSGEHAALGDFPQQFSGTANAEGLGHELVEYRNQLGSAHCKRCGSGLLIEASMLVERTSIMITRLGFLHPCLCCPYCKGWTCAGCNLFSRSYDPPMPHVVRLRQGLKVGWCCDKGRNFLIFSLLCGPGPEPPNMMPRVLAALMARSLLGRRRSPLPQGVGYSSHSIFGSRSAAAVARRPVEDSARVAELQAYFWALALVLPNMARAGGTARFDTSPQELVTVMVPRSPMLKLAYELLRGADMTQMCSTESPLGAVLDFLDALSSHWSTGRYLVCERNLYPASEQLPAVVAGLGNRNVTSSSSSSSSSTATPTTATTTPAAPTHFETAEPFHVVLNELAVRCRRFVESSVRVKLNDPPSTVLMRRICSMAELLQQTRLRADPGPSGGSAAPSVSGEEAARRAASAWHRAHCVQELPDAQILASFMLAEEEGEREHLGGARPLLLGRMRKLLAQLASLSTDLPEGIYVRHGESRPDLIKVMITGPVGTPYENGLFEFDMYCGIYFPIVPPKMIFRTTGTRAARFNPNLYTDGRVCLSLLGTWSGRAWEPDRSTLLQLLVSIQAMIFTESPYYNEPGNEHSCNRRKSNLYNRSIEWMTVRFAMVSWLQRTLADPNKLKGKGKTVEAADTSSASSVDSSSSSSSSSNAFLFPSLSTHPLPRRWGGSANDHDDPVWGEVVRHHFSTRARDALQTARVWEQLGRGTDFAGRIAKAADDLEIAAKAHGFL